MALNWSHRLNSNAYALSKNLWKWQIASKNILQFRGMEEITQVFNSCVFEIWWLLNLNSRENLYKTCGSPWSDLPTKDDPEYTLPQCYVQSVPRLHQGLFTKFQEETLFYIFYSIPNDKAQLYAKQIVSSRLVLS